MNVATVRSLIDERARVDSANPFLVDPSGRRDLSYGELREQAARVAARIASVGIRPGESVAFAMSNGPECAVCVLGILYGGFRATAINLVAGRETIAYVLAHSQTRLILTQPAHRALLDDALSDATFDEHADEGSVASPMIIEMGDGLVEVGGKRRDVIPALPANASVDGLAAGSDGLLMYTSGTTGRPKGVMLTHGNLLAGGRNTCLAHELTAADRALCVLPLFHINGLCVTLMAPLVSGGSVVLPERFSASRFWSWIRDHACSWFSVVPTQVSYLLHADPSDGPVPDADGPLRFGRSASAPLSPEMHQSFEKRFGIPLIETMGLTETSAQILANPLPPGERRIGSPGIAFGDDVMIADKQQQELPRQREGELLVRGPNVMARYFRNESETRRAFTADGWLRTGDLGRMDDDGYVFITGRLKELIIKGGENIAPREIDEALYRHEHVVEAAAFACPCDSYGQRVEAAVALEPGHAVPEDELLDLCESVLGRFKKPDRVHFLDELPKGPSGKIQRNRLRELVDP